MAAQSPTTTHDPGSTCPTTRLRRGRGLTARQRRFVEEYLIDLNATQAAVRAGYSRLTARAIGSEDGESQSDTRMRPPLLCPHKMSIGAGLRVFGRVRKWDYAWTGGLRLRPTAST